jgi:hypothetical protein
VTYQLPSSSLGKSKPERGSGQRAAAAAKSMRTTMEVWLSWARIAARPIRAGQGRNQSVIEQL